MPTNEQFIIAAIMAIVIAGVITVMAYFLGGLAILFTFLAVATFVAACATFSDINKMNSRR